MIAIRSFINVCQKRLFFSAAQFVIIFFSTTALASPDSPSSKEWVISGSVAAGAAATSVALYFVPTPECRWCGANEFDVSIAQTWASSNMPQAKQISDFLTFGVAPLMTLGAVAAVSNAKQRFAFNVLVMLDSVFATLAITQAIKVAAQRQRPEDYFGYPGTPGTENLSFLSGHTSFAFSLLSTASVLAFRERAPWAPYFAGFAAAMGLAVGYSRIAAGKHWMTDVLAGAGLGAAVGIAMPFLIYESPALSKGKVGVRIVPHFNANNLLVQLSF